MTVFMEFAFYYQTFWDGKDMIRLPCKKILSSWQVGSELRYAMQTTKYSHCNLRLIFLQGRTYLGFGSSVKEAIMVINVLNFQPFFFIYCVYCFPRGDDAYPTHHLPK